MRWAGRIVEPMERRAGRSGWLVGLGLVLAAVVASAAAAADGTLTVDGSAEAGRPAARLRPLRSFSVVAGGDVLTENAVLAAGAAAAGPGVRYDFSPVFAPVRPIVEAADLAICHMEIPIGRPGERPGVYGRSPFGGNLLLAPYEIAGALRDAGFDRCSTASNHSNDLGPVGIDSTLDAFDDVGLSHTGTARQPAEAEAPQGLVVGGVAVAHLSATRYSNTNRPSDGWRLDYAASVDDIAAEVRAARAAGAEIVIVSLHISRELDSAPSVDDRAYVTALTAAVPIDLVVEHGPHVVQPLERVNGAWVYWSVGNFVSGMGQPGATRYGPPTLDGLLAQVRFDEQEGGGFRSTASAILICNEIVDRTVHPALATLADPGISASLRGELQRCVERTRPVVPQAT